MNTEMLIEEIMLAVNNDSRRWQEKKEEIRDYCLKGEGRLAALIEFVAWFEEEIQ